MHAGGASSAERIAYAGTEKAFYDKERPTYARFATAGGRVPDVEGLAVGHVGRRLLEGRVDLVELDAVEDLDVRVREGHRQRPPAVAGGPPVPVRRVDGVDEVVRVLDGLERLRAPEVAVEHGADGQRARRVLGGARVDDVRVVGQDVVVEEDLVHAHVADLDEEGLAAPGRRAAPLPPGERVAERERRPRVRVVEPGPQGVARGLGRRVDGRDGVAFCFFVPGERVRDGRRPRGRRLVERAED